MTQRRIADIFQEKEQTFSFEFYPPKTDKGRANLMQAAGDFADFGADYFSVTYGAGGSGSRSTLEVVEGLLEQFDVSVMHHLTCVKHTFGDIRYELETMKRSGVRNIMALRGDPPQDEPDYRPGPDKPHYGFELIKVIREWGDWFTIGVPGFPEGHPLAVNLELDNMVLRVKQESGADFCVTQLFFEPELYFDFVRRVRQAGVTMRLIPGIMVVTNYKRLVDFCDMCGASVPAMIHDAFAPIADDLQATRERGIELATRFCRELLDGGAPGLHFYCLNRTEPALNICRNLGL